MASWSIVTDDTQYLSADDEDRVLVAQASTKIDRKGANRNKIRARVKGDFPIVSPSQVDFVEVSPNQILSVAAALYLF